MATLDKWLYLLGDTPRTIMFPQLSLDSGRDGEPTVIEGRGEVRMPTPSHFEYTLKGHPTDIDSVIRKLRGSQENPYDTFEQFRLRGIDAEGVHWMLGWTSPLFQEYDGGDWVLAGKVTDLTCDQTKMVEADSSVENVFEIPRDTLMAQVMTQVVYTAQEPEKPFLREHVLDILNTRIRFAYEPSTTRLTITARTSDSFEHPYAENWLAEPLRILFGQLVYPRLVARNFGDGRAMVSLRRTPGFIQDASFAALWMRAGQGVFNDPQNFWNLYGQLLTFISQTRNKDGHPNFEANPLTRFYEELVQATHGTRWVWALTLASIVEGQAKMLLQPGELRADIDEAEIDSICKHITKWEGGQDISRHAINSVKQIKEITPTRLLVRLRETGIVTANQVKSWKDIRNAVMHGKLITPWSTEEEDQKILDLANLVHTMSLQIIEGKTQQ